MQTICVVTFAVLIVALAVLFIFHLLLPMPPSNEKKIFIVSTIVGTILFEALFIATAFIPSKAEQLISQNIVLIEGKINTISPNYTDEVLDVEKVKTLISDTKQIRTYINENSDVNFIIRIIGVSAYLGYVEDFCDHIESNFLEFQEFGIPFTLHNIFNFMLDKTASPILKTTKVLEIIILVVTGLFFLFLIIFYFLHKKGVLATTNKSIVFGEE